MKITDLSTTFHTNKIDECKEFYIKYFGATLTFDHSWYATLRFQSSPGTDISISFMAAEYGASGKSYEGGATINIMVDNVDSEYATLSNMGVEFLEQITDHEWGDRAFTILDPIGNTLYIYSIREMTEQYQKSVK